MFAGSTTMPSTPPEEEKKIQTEEELEATKKAYNEIYSVPQRPDFSDDIRKFGAKPKTSEKRKRINCYFYVEFYAEPERFAEITSMLNLHIAGTHKLDSVFFYNLIKDKFNRYEKDIKDGLLFTPKLPDFSEDIRKFGEDTISKKRKNLRWLYVDFYNEPEKFAEITSMIKSHIKKIHRIDTNFFYNLIIEKFNED